MCWWSAPHATPTCGSRSAEVSNPENTPQQAAVREVHEETGIQLDPTQLQHVTDQPTDTHPGTLRFYRATTNSRQLDVDDNEIIDHQWATPTQLAQLPAFPAATMFYHLTYNHPADPPHNIGRSETG